ncbi:ATP-binding protein [Streptomyces sp. NPDC059161]|uniref:ATP-binding protein n=1 Tax=unclassified Streptomyces TaxID=2593676 RepID=UPI003646FF1C
MTIAALTPPAPPDTASTRTHRLSTANRDTAAREVRSMVCALLGATGHAGLTESAALCVSEVVGNVHRHTRSPWVHVVVTLAEGYVVVHVHDDEPQKEPWKRELADARQLADVPVSGYGLRILQQLTDGWGVTRYGGPLPASKAVWFRLDDGGRGAA